MPKRSSKKPPADPNKAATSILQQITGAPPEQVKNPAAVALGRLGGLKGGKARLAATTQEQRKETAQKAAEARWGKKKP